MNFELTERTIKDLERRCLDYVCPGHIFEIQEVKLDFIDGILWTFKICWGSSDSKIWRTGEIMFQDDEYSFDFVCGMISHEIYTKETEESVQ